MSMTMVIIAVAGIVLIGLIVMVVMGRRGSRLRPLPEGARERYAASWRAIEARFVDSPTEAVSEADQLVASLARERGAREDRISPPKAAVKDEGAESTTEHLRLAMVQRRKTIKDLLGDDPRDLRGRREIAS
jgi:hypothetical protein